MAIIEEIVEQPKVETKEEQESPIIQEQQQPDEDGDIFFESTDYQEEEMEQEAAEYKKAGNLHFGKGEYEQAITEYENALFVCPESVHKERSIYFSNIAACYLKQDEYKKARDMCNQALKLDPQYTKALLRRAQANEKLDTSSSLSDALQDYTQLKKLVHDTYTLSQCQRALRDLPSRIKAKQEREKEEMMQKLKDVGNTLLGKFGLSTDNFQFQQDPTSGGYSMNFVNK
ncbi:TPR-like protein [Backusella circina FSU 941]|nr:TPR-like protein [Backusella circina FSU 941]